MNVPFGAMTMSCSIHEWAWATEVALRRARKILEMDRDEDMMVS
jgi:hypothetical protein